MQTKTLTEALYAAFQRGDIPFIVEQLSEDVEWDTEAPESSMPWLQPRRGKAGVIAFFEALAASMSIESFTVTKVLADAEVAIGMVDIEFVVKATGKRVRERDEAHIWWFNGSGKVCKFRHRIDTLTQNRACEQ